jgi:Amt family ammonium transporter
MMRPHNLTMTLIGTAMLWFGWFGFNAGSAGAANAQAVNAFVATHISAATAAFVWMLIDWKVYGKPTALGAATGAVAGLVGITPGAGYVGPMAAVAIGAIVSCICFYAVTLKNRFGYDDTLDVFGVHCVGGIWGALAAGIFASYTATGLLMGNVHQFMVQMIAVLITLSYAMTVTWIIGRVLDKTMGLRVTAENEMLGLDQSEHGESGYEMFEVTVQ